MRVFADETPFKKSGVILSGTASTDEKQSHYTDVENKAFKPTPEEKDTGYQTKYEEDFISASKDFWQKNFPDCLQGYKQGDIDGKFGKKDLTIPNFFNRIYKEIESIVFNKLNQDVKTAGKFKNHLKVLENMLTLLGNDLKEEQTEDDIKNCAAQLQGFINSFIQNNIKEDN